MDLAALCPPLRSFVASEDAIPYGAALDRLIRAKVVSDDQLADYELNQALRGLTVAVKNSALSLPAPFSSKVNGVETAEKGFLIYGREAVLFRMCQVAVMQPASLPILVYLSTRLLCDQATAYGEGNERPCCTPEWTQALLCCGALSSEDGDGGVAAMLPSKPFRAQVTVDRRFQLGYFRIVAGTLRMIANGAAAGRHLFTNFLALVQSVFTRLLPFAAILAEGKADAIGSASALSNRSTASATAPSLLTVEANNFIIQCTQWLSMDALAVHLSESGGKKGTATHVLDRDVPQRMWTNVPRLRAALHRSWLWLDAEMKHHVEALVQEQQRQRHPKAALTTREQGDVVIPAKDANAKTPPPSSSLTAVDTHVALSFVRAARGHVDAVLSELLTAQERLDFARRAAVQRYGESAKDVHNISEAMWGETLRLYILLQNLTGAWLGVHGGLGLGAAGSGVVFQSNRDVLVFVAACLSKLPVSGEGSSVRERNGNVSAATDALLTSVVVIAAAAPLSTMQVELWSTDGGRITRELHSALTQRGLRFKEARVLQLASLLLNSIMSTVGSGFAGSAQLGSETADQLMDMLSDSRDAASRVAVDLLMNAVAQRPHVLVPALFRLLKSDNANARTNALDVIAGLPQALQANGKIHSLPPEKDGTESAAHQIFVDQGKGREVLRLLAEELLLHLQDEELVTRVQSASLFAKVWPEDVLYPLLNLCLQHDPRGVKQSAAKTALKSVVSAHSNDTNVLLVLFGAALELLAATAGTQHSEIQDNSTGMGDGKAAPAAVSPPLAVPTTPGEIFTKSLLYTPAQAPGEEDSTQPAAGKTGFTVKAERLHALVSSLCTVWAKHVDEHATSRPFPDLQPIMALLKAQTDSGAQQFYVRHVTSLLGSLTAQQRSIETAPHSITLAQVVVVEGVRDGLIAKGHAAEGVAHDSSWLERVASAAEDEITNHDSVSEDCLYQILLPLLCLRSCDRCCFSAVAVAPAPDGVATSAAEEVLDCIFKALLEPPYATFFHHHQNDIQRVLLEVACKAPPQVLLARIGAEKQQWGVRGISGTESLFIARITVFAVCSYLSTSPWEKNLGPNILLETVADVVLDLWAAVFDEKLMVTREFGAHTRALEQGLFDAAALLCLDALYSGDSSLYERLQPTLLSTNLSPDHPDSVRKVTLTLAVHDHMLMIVRAHQKAPALLLLWFTHFQEQVMRLANIACKVEEKPCPTAVKCGELIFRAIMLSSKTTLSSPSGASSPSAGRPVVDIHAASKTVARAPTVELKGEETPSFLMRNADAVNCDALVSFGKGCAHAKYGVPLQQVGVRILAALLGAALDCLLTMDPSPLDSIASLLQSVAVIHEDAATRQLAEQVLHSMPALGGSEC